jgi:hypothetical protein
MEARLFANYKDALFASLVRDRKSRTGRANVIIANKLAKLGIYFFEFSQHIVNRAPRVRLNISDVGQTASASVSAIQDDKLQNLMKAVKYVYHIDTSLNLQRRVQDLSLLLLFDTESLINETIKEEDKKIYGYALYLDPRPCRRLVFFGAGTHKEAREILDTFRTNNFDWTNYSKSYAKWILENQPIQN